MRSDSEELDALAASLHLFATTRKTDPPWVPTFSVFVCIFAFIALYTYEDPCDMNLSMGAYGYIVLHVGMTGTSSCHGLTSCGPLSWCPSGLGRDSKFAV